MSGTYTQLTRDLVRIFALGLLFRLALLILFPVPYGNDAAGRLYFRDMLLTWHWLPVTQALVYVPFVSTHSIVAVRLIFAIAGSLAAVGFAFYMQTFASPRATLIGGALFALNAHAVFLSLMPYQEVVFLGLLFTALGFFARGRSAPHARLYFVIGSVFYGLACLTRYEAWFILPALLLAGIFPAIRTRRFDIFTRSLIFQLAGLSWGPLMWLGINWLQWGSPFAFLFHRADQSFYAWNPHGEFGRIVEYAGNMLYWLLRFGSPFILFAIPGIWMCSKNRRGLLPALWPVLVLTVFALGFLTFVAGREFATANRFAMIPLAVLLIFTGIGIDELLRRLQYSTSFFSQFFAQRVPRIVTASVMIVFLLAYGAVPVVQANHLAEYRDPYEIAEFLRPYIKRNEKAIIVAKSYDGEVPMPYQRIFGQLAFDKEQLTCSWFIKPGEVEAFLRQRDVTHVVFWNDGEPRYDTGLYQQTITTGRIVFRNDAAVIYRCDPRRGGVSAGIDDGKD